MKRSLVVFYLLIFSSCFSKAPDFFPVDSIPQEEASVNNLVLKFNNQTSTLDSFKTLGTIELSHRSRRDKFSLNYFFERPDKVRLTFLYPGLNQMALLLVANKNQLFIHDEVQKKKTLTEISSNEFERYLYIPLELEELMLWSLALWQIDSSSISEHKKLKDITYLKILEKERTIYLAIRELSSGACRLESFRIDRGEKMLFSSSYTYFEEDILMPRVLEFYFETKSVKGIMNYQKFELNPDLSGLSEQLFGL